MDLGDIATWVGALAALLAGGFAGLQLFHLRREAERRREDELNGVAVSWRPETSRHIDAEGYVTWTYAILVQNPAAVPIRDVNVSLAFPCAVSRVHYDGASDPPDRKLDVGAAVVFGGVTEKWNRRIRFPAAERESLRHISGTVTFLDMRGLPHTNVWSSTRRETGLAPVARSATAADATR